MDTPPEWEFFVAITGVGLAAAFFTNSFVNSSFIDFGVKRQPRQPTTSLPSSLFHRCEGLRCVVPELSPIYPIIPQGSIRMC